MVPRINRERHCGFSGLMSLLQGEEGDLSSESFSARRGDDSEVGEIPGIGCRSINKENDSLCVRNDPPSIEIGGGGLKPIE